MTVTFNDSKIFLTVLYTFIAVAFISDFVLSGFSCWTIWNICNILLCILYVATLYRLCIYSNDQMNYAINNQMVHDISTNAGLSLVAIGSTMVIWYGFSITSWISLFSIDSIINCWFVFLLCADNQKLLQCICCGCHKNSIGMENGEFVELYERNGAELMTDNKIIIVEADGCVNRV